MPSGAMRFNKVCVVMQQASSGEQLAALQQELEQLRADNAHMEGQVKAAQAAQVFPVSLLFAAYGSASFCLLSGFSPQNTSRQALPM